MSASESSACVHTVMAVQCAATENASRRWSIGVAERMLAVAREAGVPPALYRALAEVLENPYRANAVPPTV